MGNFPCYEADVWMQVQGNMQENPGLLSVMCGVMEPTGKNSCRFFAMEVILACAYPAGVKFKRNDNNKCGDTKR